MNTKKNYLMFENTYITDYFCCKLRIYPDKVEYLKRHGTIRFTESYIGLESQIIIEYKDIIRVRAGHLGGKYIKIKTPQNTFKIETSAPRKISKIISEHSNSIKLKEAFDAGKDI